MPGAAALDRNDEVAWTPSEAAAVVLVAHVTLIVASVVVFSAGGWSTDGVPTWGQFLTVVPFWGVGVFLSARLFVRASPAVPRRAALRAVVCGEEVGHHRSVAQLVSSAAVGAAAGIVTSWFLIPLVYAPLHEWWGTSPDELEQLARETVNRADGWFAVTLLVVMTCVGAPVAEEVMYRGVLQPALHRWGVAVSIIVSSAVFAVAHFQTLQLVGLFVIGAVLGVLRWRTRGLLAPIVAHMGFNLVTVVALLTQR